MSKLYLDIDGVLIGKNRKIPDGIDSFLEYILKEFELYWLTTHCKGDRTPVFKYLGEFYPESYLPYWKQIKVSNWDVLKTEAINFDSDFIWLDDQPLQSELLQLAKHNKLNNLIQVDLREENELDRIIRCLEEIKNKA